MESQHRICRIIFQLTISTTFIPQAHELQTWRSLDSSWVTEVREAMATTAGEAETMTMTGEGLIREGGPMATAAALHPEMEAFQMEVEAATTTAVAMEVAATKPEATTMIEAEATVARTMGTAPAKEMVTAEDTAAKEVAMAEATVAMAEATVVMAKGTATMAEDITMEATVAKETGVP